ncbi:MAG: hypothetical protein GXP31_07480 [Kiritimatiellaeota bacterium]|nr:hypothetical protein [Kiritimatiellota bacterium]
MIHRVLAPFALTALLTAVSAAPPKTPPASSAPRELIVNGRFENGLDGWGFQPGNSAMVSLNKAPGIPGQAVHFRPRGAPLGLNSTPLTFGRELRRKRCYRLEARLRFGGLKQGIAALSVCLYDETGKRIRQYSIASWSTRSKPHDWIVRSAVIGPGTPFPFDLKAATLRVRLSFYDRDGKCEGDIHLADVSLKEATRGRFADWPASILVDCGDIQTRFEARSFWTLYRLDYKGTRLCKDQFGSHYGSVASFPGTGFVGSGHSEHGETESVDELTLRVDGRPLDPPPARVSGSRIELHKRSHLRVLDLDTTVTILPDRIVEQVGVKAEKPQKLNLFYHFMHPWVTDMDRFIAVKADGSELEGAFVGDKQMKVGVPVRWSAVYSGELEMGAVTVVLDAPRDTKWLVWYWDVPGRYRKHYFVTFRNETVPTGRTFSYRIATIPFAAAPETWKETAKRVAATVDAGM